MTYATEASQPSQSAKPASKIPPPGILKNAGGPSKVAAKGKMTAKDKKARDVRSA